MDPSKKISKEIFKFRTGFGTCSFFLERKGEEVFLFGEEREGDRLLFRECLSFPRALDPRVDEFARTLAKTETLPRMMAELAEDYFF